MLTWALSRAHLYFTSVGRKAEYCLTIYFGSHHCSPLPKKNSQSKLARQHTNDICTCYWETTTDFASSHIIVSLMVGNSNGNLNYCIASFILNVDQFRYLEFKTSILSLLNQPRVSCNIPLRSHQLQKSNNISTQIETLYRSA